ncbi:phenylacetic acid degradation operon negative regulatory protein PaaX [Rhizobiaceae bacterium n13]|uniref:Phenylacetic acid degradation operon negative regulatory protein PaaX n=1 Tax=Ferirhizobium litorale TaxID=2927786 RepID=A0AAE3QJ40_9HYPH|nr:phenylacetic acid degradation operon negative regulatory protein PaaX [Fererhizobium litorale]MDI7924351.1 phenylacetic acid degradation operon negative regulatory protein PaaX [Fererhizobium litorale]
MRSVLGQILDRLHDQPSRTWSIIITFYGDALLPRGGSVWLGTLLSFFRGLDIAEGVVRTAVSRLAADGWLQRTKVGRNSFYRLDDKGHDTFAEAAERIYGWHAPEWDGQFRLVLPSQGNDREVVRASLEAAGYGSPGPAMYVGLPSWPLPVPVQTELTLSVGGGSDEMKELVVRSWPIEDLAELYRNFIATFEPLRAALAAGARPSEIDAITARIILIHEFRRIVLRDPSLPDAVLPDDWPGRAARQLSGDLYRLLAVPSERWLDQALNEDGPLPRAAIDIGHRFRKN